MVEAPSPPALNEEAASQFPKLRMRRSARSAKWLIGLIAVQSPIWILFAAQLSRQPHFAFVPFAIVCAGVLIWRSELPTNSKDRQRGDAFLILLMMAL